MSMQSDTPSGQTSPYPGAESGPRPVPIPGAYVLVPGAIGTDDALDIYRLFAGCWRRRWVFIATLLLTSIPLSAWAMRGAPPTSASVVVAPATSGLGPAGTQAIVPLAAMAAYTNEIVIEGLRTTRGDLTEPSPFEDLKVEAVVLGGADFLRIGGTSPAGGVADLEAFLALVVKQLSDQQKEMSERMQRELEHEIEQITATIEALRLAAQATVPGSAEHAQIDLEIVKQETRVRGLRLQQALMLPTRELRGFMADDSAAAGWRTRRIGVAAIAAAAMAIAALSIAALADGVRRHASRP